MMPQILLVGMLERRAGKDDVLATIPCIVDQPGKRLEPGFSIFVGQSDAKAHLLDVRRRMGFFRFKVRGLGFLSVLSEPVLLLA